MIKEGGTDQTTAPPQLIVVQHFDEELKHLVPTKEREARPATNPVLAGLDLTGRGADQPATRSPRRGIPRCG